MRFGQFKIYAEARQAARMPELCPRNAQFVAIRAGADLLGDLIGR